MRLFAAMYFHEFGKIYGVFVCVPRPPLYYLASPILPYGVAMPKSWKTYIDSRMYVCGTNVLKRFESSGAVRVYINI